MKLVQLDIENFRGIKKLSVPLDETTVLIGENNSGKSSVLDALHTCLSRSLNRKSGQFAEYDYHLPAEDSQPADADPITITLRFAEKAKDEWPDTVLQAFPKAMQVDADSGLNTLTLRVTSRFDSASNGFLTQWDFLDGAGNPMTGAKDPRLAGALPQFAPVFYLAALRDAAQEFRPRSQFWGPFVRSVKIEDDVRKELEEALSELNQRVLDAHTTFDGVKERLKETMHLVPLGSDEPVHIEALPGKVFDMLSKTQVMLTCRSGARLPLYRHGEGTQSLAVIFLFDAFLRNRLSEDYDKDAEPILAMEEPEAHLHPSAIRSLAVLLQELKGQKLIATHSGDLLAGIPLKSIRRLARENGEIKLYQLGKTTLSPEELEKVTYHIRSQRGHLLFARCWLLVEGQSEYRLIPELARQMTVAFDLHSVCCVEFSQFGKLDVIIRLADDLGIAWHVLTDNDTAGKDYTQKAIDSLNGRQQADHLTILAQPDVEHVMWHAGYDSVYEQEVTPQQRRALGSAKGAPDYPTKVIKAAISATSKPFLATAVAVAAAKPGSPGIPTALDVMIKTVVGLAKKAR
ncbi:DUF2813 domain-containing protein [Candidatus Bathyarchaeota archaeon]|nr:DUF2813 domain-containing protein [Candidatus Bathyarchaeota archaeon]